MLDWIASVRDHYETFWKVRSLGCEFYAGPTQQLSPGFVVVKLAPADIAPLVIYATAGMSRPQDDLALELFLLSPRESVEIIELLYAIAHFHQTGSRLWFGHTVNIGRPWLRGSSCDRALISLPYLQGPRLQHGNSTGGRFDVGWLIPVTASEVIFKREHGVDALEDLFERESFNYADPFRQSVVGPAE